MASSKLGNLADRMKHLLGTAKLADAHFLVGGGDGKELFSAHKNILVSASDVFEAMFRFDSQNGKAENADKYGIDGLISHCLQIPIQNLSNVFLAHAYARLFNLEFHCHPISAVCPALNPTGNRGTLALEIEKFSEFAREKVGSKRNNEAVQMKGFEWKILAKINTEKESNEKCLGFYFFYSAPTNAGNWSCKCSATLRIVSQKYGTEDFTKKCDRVFDNKSVGWRFPFFITFTKLMDLDKGLYDKNEDKVTLAIDFTVEEEKETKRKLAKK
ncbi:hypothetical protein niasHS_016690 [Heterodera schachtii]|uniref:BTB domain-containing protein n=1 Tax=Heterodera schachtii TaxID=97005 RepID=A0ABD2HWQ3_HETSC